MVHLINKSYWWRFVGISIWKFNSYPPNTSLIRTCNQKSCKTNWIAQKFITTNPNLELKLRNSLRTINKHVNCNYNTVATRNQGSSIPSLCILKHNSRFRQKTMKENAIRKLKKNYPLELRVLFRNPQTANRQNLKMQFRIFILKRSVDTICKLKTKINLEQNWKEKTTH